MFSRLFIVFAISLGVLPASTVFAGDEMDVDQHQVIDPSDSTYRDVGKGDGLDVNSSAKYGVLGNIGRPVTAGGSVKHDELQLGTSDFTNMLSGDKEKAFKKNEILGCSTMDFHAAAITSLNTNEDHVKEYVDSPMGTYMLTTLLNSPAIAATFNTVEAFGGQRVQLMQDRCQAMQADATVSAEGMMRWQALQACVAKNVDANLNTSAPSDSARNEKESVAVALAYRACLYGSQGQEGNFSGEAITAFGEDVTPGATLNSLEFALYDDVLQGDGDNPSLWTGTLFHALRNTAFCKAEGGGADGDTATEAEPDSVGNFGHECALLAMIPNVRWCAGSEMVDRKCLADSKVRMSRSTFTPQQVFDLIFAFSEVELAYRNRFAIALEGRLDPQLAKEIAIKGEVLYNPMTDNRTAADAGVGSGGIDRRSDEIRLMLGCINGGSDAYGAEDFSEYIDRAIALDPDDNLKHTMVVEQHPNVLLTTVWSDLKSQFPAPDAYDILDLVHDDLVDDNMSARATVGDSATAPSGRAYNINTAAILIGEATRCVLRHHTRLTLMDHLMLSKLSDEERIGALLAVRLSVAQTTTEVLYRHIKEKLLLAHMDMQNGGSVSSRRATPPHVLASLETLVKIIDNQIEHMEALRGRQQEMSNLLSVVRGEARRGFTR